MTWMLCKCQSLICRMYFYQYIPGLISCILGRRVATGQLTNNSHQWWSSPGILHCTVVCPHNVTLTHWWVNGEHCLVGACNRISYSRGLLVGSIESYHSSISPPGDSGSRSTSGGAGESPGLIITSQTGYTEGTWKGWQTDNGNTQPCSVKGRW